MLMQPVLEEKIKNALQNLDGWCSLEKALALASLILENRPKLVVEIGVYGGRSLIPQALALKHIGQGIIYAIDDWRSDTANIFPTNAINDEWWEKVDLLKIKKGFVSSLVINDVTDIVKIAEAPSARAHLLFDTIDMIHIDGGHSSAAALLDVANFIPKLIPGGILVFDDVNWKSTAPAIDVVGNFCTEIGDVKNDKGEITCKFYRKNLA